MSDLIPDPEDPSLFIIASASEPVFGAHQGASTLVNVHGADRCAGRHCVVHNPSDHHMRTWPLNWRDDRGMMERVCPHFIGHPDPDDMAYHREVVRKDLGVHGCDGCCNPETFFSVLRNLR